MHFFLVFILSCFHLCWSQNQIVLSTVECKRKPGYEEENRICIFKNLYFFNETFYFVDDSGKKEIKGIRISNTFFMHPPWQPTIISQHEASRIFSNEVAPFQRAILWRGLNPLNWYHFLFEDYQQILKVRQMVENVSFSEVSDHQLLFVTRGHFYATFSWFFLRKPLLISDLSKQYPKGVRVPYLLAGTENECAHRWHCKHESGSKPLLEFRKAIFSKFSINQIPAHPADFIEPTIQVVQRRSSRRFLDLDKALSGIKYRSSIHYLEGTNPRSQVELFSKHNIYFMMHGGAVGNWMFLKPNALVIDVRPFNHYHPLTNWIVTDMCSLNITMISFFLNYTDAVPYMDKIQKLQEWNRLSSSEQTEFEKFHFCNKRVCEHFLFFQSDYLITSALLNLIFEYALRFYQAPAKACRHVHVRLDAQNNNIIEFTPKVVGP